MSESFHDGRVVLHAGDCLAVLDSLPENSVDAICTDPPYHLTSIVKRFGGKNASAAKDYTGDNEKATGAYARASRGFMGKQWDGGDIAFTPELWAKVLRVLKPGGHVVAFSGTRTYHRMAVAIEDAGFEIRDQLAWAYGSGFPKSHDVSKAIDKTLGYEREKIRIDASQVRNPKATGAGRDGMQGATRPWIEEALEKGYHEAASPEAASPEAASPEAALWNGWGTALKPAWEPICLARKPLDGTVAENVLRHGVGALNIDASRIGDFINTAPPGTDRFNADNFEKGYRPSSYGRSGEASAQRRYTEAGATNFAAQPGPRGGSPTGRWPANLAHDGSDEVASLFPQSDGQLAAVGPQHGRKDSVNCYGDYGPRDHTPPRGDSGSAARFFYSAKADATDRAFSKHPTVKPVALMRWLVRMVTPPGGTVLDPFAGTGTTGHAALLEGFNAVLIEREAEYQADIRRRMSLVFAGSIERTSMKEAAPAESLPLFGNVEATE